MNACSTGFDAAIARALVLVVLLLAIAGCSKSPPEVAAGTPTPTPPVSTTEPAATTDPPAPPPGSLPAGHATPLDTTPKEGPRLLPAEAYIRTYLQLFGGLSPLQAQQVAVGNDGAQLFDTWSDYLGVLGLPDYRFDTPRLPQNNALMMASFERLGVALCDRSLERDRTATPRMIFDFDMPATITAQEFATRFDVLHRTFLNYPAAIAPTDRIARFHQLYLDTMKLHVAPDGGPMRFKAHEAGWAAVCYGLVRHPEFHLY